MENENHRKSENFFGIFKFQDIFLEDRVINQNT